LLLSRGAIVAIKGLGGYHLACDATNEAAVALLRKRKRRTAKPFALMVRTVADARALCRVNAQEAALLSGTVRPIVLLERKEGWNHLAPSVAGKLHELGIMLPATPVQHLLMDIIPTPLVMTSGNISEEPIIAREAEAHELLAGVADAFLDNDREILSRYDDSVARVIGERVCLIRRARGFAPKPLRLSPTLAKEGAPKPRRPVILAVGPEQKSTFCLVSGENAFVSQHLGDLENASAFAAWLATLALYERLFGLDHQLLVCDKHPEYLSTKWAREQSEARVEVQHHHAHIASVLAEHRAASRDGSLPARVIGIAFDGSGYGDDRTIWGGEALIADLEGFERFAHLRAVPLPGGRGAIDHPDRMAWAYLRTFGLTERPGAEVLIATLGRERAALLDQIIANHINTPMTTSMGRLFDAASALAGVCFASSYEGQAAVELEAALYDSTTRRPVTDANARDAAKRYRFRIADAAIPSGGSGIIDARWPDGANASRLIDPQPVLAALLADRAVGVSSSLVALRFHNAVAALIVDLCDQARARTGLSMVALSGGVFMNRYLVTRVVELLEGEGFTVLLNRELPANDGCISYGQAAIAAARLARTDDEETNRKRKGSAPCV
jgi:hydrogenase maturation protein HypF